MQHMNVELTIPIPPNSILINKVEYEKLKQDQLSGVYWTMQDLEKRIGRKAEWIKTNILYRPKLKEALDCKHGGFVFYPKSKGQSWSFQAFKMSEFLDKYFSVIFNSQENESLLIKKKKENK